MNTFLVLFLLCFSIANGEVVTLKSKGTGGEVVELKVHTETAEFSVLVGGDKWFKSGLFFFHTHDCWYYLTPNETFSFNKWRFRESPRSHSPTVLLQNEGGGDKINGYDRKFGEYSELRLHFFAPSPIVLGCNTSMPDGGDSTGILRVTMSFKVFQNIQMILFDLSLPDGLRFSSVQNPYSVATSFPSFSAVPPASLSNILGKKVGGVRGGDPLFPEGTSVLTWEGLFSPGEVRVGSMGNYTGGVKGGVPLLFWNNSESVPSTVAVLSPFDDFFSSRIVPYYLEGEEGEGEEEKDVGGLGCGISGTILDISKSYSTSFILQFSQKGMTDAMLSWGSSLLAKGDKIMRPDSEVEDFSTRYLGYWTDAGAYYYYNTAPGLNYEETMQAIQDYHKSLEIPVRYYEIDSWFYLRGHVEKNSTCSSIKHCGGGVIEWDAQPSVFPKGMEGVHEQLGTPLAVHCKHWSPNNVYTKDYSFEIEKMEALPTDPSFYPFLFGQANSWGVTNFKQDWLSVQYDHMEYTQVHTGVTEDWLIHMGNGASLYNISIQYCMPFPQFWVMSSFIPSVTSSRASNDYMSINNPPNWDIGKTSLLLWSLGLAPSKDVFWSRSNQKGAPSHPSDPFVELNPRMNAIIAALSCGSVAFGDGIGFTNASLIKSLCHSSGELLRPDRPAFPIEKSFGTSPPEGGQIWATYTTLINSSHGALTYGYILSISIQEDYPVTPQDVFLDPNLDYVVIEDEDTSLENPVLFSSNRPFVVPKASQPGVYWNRGKQYSQFFRAYPIFPSSKWCFMGEITPSLSPLLPLSWTRTRQSKPGFEDDLGGFSVRLGGEIGEKFTVGAVPPGGWGEGGMRKVAVVECVVGEEGVVVVRCKTEEGECYCD